MLSAARHRPDSPLRTSSPGCTLPAAAASRSFAGETGPISFEPRLMYQSTMAGSTQSNTWSRRRGPLRPASPADDLYQKRRRNCDESPCP